MKGFNRVFIMGNLGSQPELLQSQNGEFYTRLSIANNYKDNTDWFNVMVWGPQAQNAAKYLEKGSGVMVEAYLDTYSKQKANGEDETRLGLKARSLQFLPSSRPTS